MDYEISEKTLRIISRYHGIEGVDTSGMRRDEIVKLIEEKSGRKIKKELPRIRKLLERFTELHPLDIDYYIGYRRMIWKFFLVKLQWYVWGILHYRELRK